MTTETTNAQQAESSSTHVGGERWLDPVPTDWTGWLAFRAAATASHQRNESLRHWLANHVAEGEHLQRGLGLFAAGDAERALPHLQAASGDLPRLLSGYALSLLGRASQAVEAFRQLVRSSSVGAQARVALADELYVRRDGEGLAAARAQLAGEAEQAFGEGLAHDLDGDHDQAVGAFERALAAQPGFPEATFRLASVLERGGADDEAIDLYDRFRTGELPPCSGALMNLGLMHLDRESPGWAVLCFQLVVDAEPTNFRARRYLRDALASTGQYYDESRERKADKQNAVLRTPVTDFELSVRARNCLQRMNIHTLGDLVSRSESELLSFKNFGETSLQEVKDILAMKGLRLGMPASALTASVPAEPGRAIPSGSAASGDPLEINISDLDLSVRSRAALATLGITKVRELVKTTETTLLSCKNFGQTSLDEIRSKLRNLGLELTG